MDFFDWRERRGESADEASERLASEIIASAIEVHRALGPGLLEKVYERALCVELSLRGIPFQQQAQLPVQYKGQSVGDSIVDLIVADRVVVELKSIEQITDVHRSQVIAYLHITGLRLGLLINFNVSLLKNGVKRIVLDKPN